jgi:hypothetical protein
MPTISTFYCITIRMYLNEHPPPHFHAEYGDDEACISIATGDITDGRLPRNAARLVKEWALAHGTELSDNWNRARSNRLPEKIAGLDVD